MDEFSNSYQPENYDQDNHVEGDYKLKIKSVETKIAKSSGNPMIAITLTAQGFSFDFTYNLVKNEHFNANATKFFDCFKIPRGNFEYPRWVGRMGDGHIAKGKVKDNGKSYWEIQYLIVAPAVGSAAGARAPVAPAAAPAAQAYSPPNFASAPPQRPAPAPAGDDFTDDIPF